MVFDKESGETGGNIAPVDNVKKMLFQTNFTVKKDLTMDGMSNFESTREQNQVCLDCELCHLTDFL